MHRLTEGALNGQDGSLHAETNSTQHRTVMRSMGYGAEPHVSQTQITKC
jgi:hypothetical protein